MRRLAVLLCACMCLPLLTGCRTQPAQADERIQVVATVFPQYDFARAIAGEYADVTLLLSAGQEMHNYEPTPMDMADIAQCDIFLRIGGESEVWTDKLLKAIDTSHMDVVTLMEHIEVPLAEEHHHHHHHEEEAHDEDEHTAEEVCDGAHEHGEFDEHIWNSPVNAIAMVEAVCESLCDADAAHAEIFRERADAYIAQLRELDEKYRTLSEECEDPVLMIGDKFPFRYLAAEYGFHYAAAFTGCSSETEPTIGALAKLFEEAKHHGLDTVFYLEFSSTKIADRISAVTGAETVMLHPCHNVSKEDMQNGTTFLDLMQENYEVIKEALT
ncbi:MAG: zinc ABC transporter substrate-binding protein [Oscillospiraceae bacterium]|nr:zinc ABC transporter substrate-binding protein [Oscillospiraceae bacterium]